MKKKILLAVAITAVVTGVLVFSVFALALRPTPLVVTPVDLTLVQDGEYIGVCQNKILLAVVRVSVYNHQIAAIEVLHHKTAYMEQAASTANQVVALQTLHVDNIAGATLTSHTVKKAIEHALLQGIPNFTQGEVLHDGFEFD